MTAINNWGFVDNCYCEVQSKDNVTHVYIVGQLNRDIDFLARNKKGDVVTPFLIQRDDNEVTMSNAGKAFTVKANKLVEVEIPSKPTSIKHRNVKVPCVAVNTGENNSSVKYYPLVAFKKQAIKLHKEIKKGDTVAIWGRVQLTQITGTDLSFPLVWVEDVNLVRMSNRRTKEEAFSIDDGN